MERGMKKWKPFAALPEQFSSLQQIIEQQQRIDKPIVDQQTHEWINQAAHQAIHMKKNVSLTYYENGRINVIEGIITNFDPNQNKLYLKDKMDNILLFDGNEIVNIDIEE